MKPDLAELFAMQRFAQDEHLAQLIEQCEQDCCFAKTQEELSDDELQLFAAGDIPYDTKGEWPHV